MARRAAASAATTTCSSATSLPFLLSTGLHEFEAWNEAVADGAWGTRLRGVGEKVRRAVDLEHWAAFQDGFRDVADMVVRGRRRQARRAYRRRSRSCPATCTTPTSPRSTATARAGSSRRRARRSATRCRRAVRYLAAFSSQEHRSRIGDRPGAVGEGAAATVQLADGPRARGSTTTSRPWRPTAASSGSAGRRASSKNDDHAHPVLEVVAEHRVDD